MKCTKVIVTALVAAILSVLVYFSPDQAYWYQKSSEDAIRLGRSFAFYLLNGYKDGLLELAVDPARDSIANTTFPQVSLYEISNTLENKKIHVDLIGPLYSEQKDEEMQLASFEQVESFLVMTFAFTHFERIVEIPNKGKLLFSVAIRYRYYQIEDDQWFPKLIRKIANLPLLRNFTGSLGTTGRWVVFDYYNKFNLTDYYQWVLDNGEAYTLKQAEEIERFTQEMNRPDFLKEFTEQAQLSADTTVGFLYDWAYFATRKQVERIENLYNTVQSK